MAPDDLNAPSGSTRTSRARRARGCSACRRCWPHCWRRPAWWSRSGRPSSTIRSAASRSPWWPTQPAAGATAKTEGGTASRPSARRRRPGATRPPADGDRRSEGAARRQDRHHHRRLERQAPGGRRFRRQAATSTPRCAPADQKLLEATRHGADPAIARTARVRSTAYARPRVLPAGQARLPAHRHRRRRPRHQRRRHRRRHRMLPAPVTFAFVALWRRSAECSPSARAPPATKCCCKCRWSRSTIRTTTPARRRCSPR